ncbi:MAG: secretin N-terminal domain-containing protein [Magnetococcus sp. DMHC-1]|nr:secretin N-terminal domain-containing protein [Magnetococcales bacterium]
MTRLLCGTLALWLHGCQSILPSPELEKEIQEARNMARQQVQPPESINKEVQESRDISRQQAQPPEATIPATPTHQTSRTAPPPAVIPEPEPLFDIQVTEAPVRSVLEGVVAGTPYSLVLDPKVSGTISLNLKQVTISETVQAICRLQNFDCRLMRQGYMIFANQLTSKVFQVHYPDMDRKGSSSLRVSSGQNSSSSSSSSSSTSQTSQQQNSSAQNASGTQLDTTFSSDFWQELTDVLCMTLGINKSGTSTTGQGSGTSLASGQGAGATTTSTQGGGSTSASTGSGSGGKYSCSGSNDGLERNVSISRQTGLVMVRALPSELLRVESIINRMKNTLERQVVLEAKFIEVELNSGFESGINWSSLVRTGSGKSITVGQTGGGSLLTPMERPSDMITMLPPPGTVTATNWNNHGTLPQGTPGFQIPYSAFGGVLGVGIQLRDFQGFLELLESQGKVHVISSPRIATLNSQKAVIRVGADDFFVTGIQREAATANSAGSTNFILSQFFSGVALDVVPRIGEDNVVTMHIHPTIARATTRERQIGGQNFPLANSATRESDSIVRARSGEIVVIGGLMTEENRQERAQVPILGNLPVIGSFFGQNRDQKVKTELVILIKPTIIESPVAPSSVITPEWN